MEHNQYPGRLWAAENTQPTTVTVILAPHGLAIDTGAPERLWWPFDQTQAAMSAGGLRFDHGGALLEVEGAAFAAAYQRVRGRRSRELSWALVLGCIAVAVLGVLVSFLLYGFSWLTTVMASYLPVKTEEAIGRASLESLAPKSKRCVDPSVGRIVARLEKALPDSRYTYRVYVVEDPMVNAFAAPGGYIVMFRGLLDRTRRAEEAAAVLAHEMQHVEHRHSVRGMLRGVSIWVALALLTGDPTDGLASLAGSLGALHYQRADEEEADQEGLRLLEAAHVDPMAMTGMLERLQEVTGELPRAAKYLSSHPLTEDRVKEIRSRAEKVKGRIEPMLPGREWPPKKAACVAEERSE